MLTSLLLLGILHTLVVNGENPPCNGGQTGPEVLATTEAHRHLRYKVQTGKFEVDGVGFWPAARAEIPQIVWDCDLERSAIKRAAECRDDHPENGTYGESTMVLNDQYPWPNTQHMYQDGRKKALAHWEADLHKRGLQSLEGTQMIWAKTTRVGCAIHDCKTQNMYFYVCHYTVKGNVPGMAIYAAQSKNLMVTYPLNVPKRTTTSIGRRTTPLTSNITSTPAVPGPHAGGPVDESTQKPHEIAHPTIVTTVTTPKPTTPSTIMTTVTTSKPTTTYTVAHTPQPRIPGPGYSQSPNSPRDGAATPSISDVPTSTRIPGDHTNASSGPKSPKQTAKDPEHDHTTKRPDIGATLPSESAVPRSTRIPGDHTDASNGPKSPKYTTSSSHFPGDHADPSNGSNSPTSANFEESSTQSPGDRNTENMSTKPRVGDHTTATPSLGGHTTNDGKEMNPSNKKMIPTSTQSPEGPKDPRIGPNSPTEKADQTTTQSPPSQTTPRNPNHEAGKQGSTPPGTHATENDTGTTVHPFGLGGLGGSDDKNGTILKSQESILIIDPKTGKTTVGNVTEFSPEVRLAVQKIIESVMNGTNLHGKIRITRRRERIISTEDIELIVDKDEKNGTLAAASTH